MNDGTISAYAPAGVPEVAAAATPAPAAVHPLGGEYVSGGTRRTVSAYVSDVAAPAVPASYVSGVAVHTVPASYVDTEA